MSSIWKKENKPQTKTTFLEQILCATELFGIKAILLSLGIFLYFNQIDTNIYIDFLHCLLYRRY